MCPTGRTGRTNHHRIAVPNGFPDIRRALGVSVATVAVRKFALPPHTIYRIDRICDRAAEQCPVRRVSYARAPASTVDPTARPLH